MGIHKVTYMMQQANILQHLANWSESFWIWADQQGWQYGTRLIFA